MSMSISGNYVRRSGDTMTGPLNMGLNKIYLTNGVTGGVIQGSGFSANWIEVRNMSGIGLGNMCVSSLDLTGSIVMDPTMVVDGIDISDGIIRIIDIMNLQLGLVSNTSEQTLRTVTVPAGTMKAKGTLRIRAAGWSSGNNGIKTFKLKWDGNIIATIVQAASASPIGWQLECIINNTDSESDQQIIVQAIDDTTIVINDADGGQAADTSGAINIVFTGQLENMADAGVLRSMIVEVNSKP